MITMTDHTYAHMSETEAEAEAQRLIDDAYRPAPAVPTSYRDPSPVPAVGDSPPVAQPGRPPMSQRAADASGVMLAGGIASLLVGGSASLVLYSLGQVDPVTLAIAAGAPVAFVAALSKVVRALSASAVHTEHHHHYTGPVEQDHTTVNVRKAVVKRSHLHG
jgi:hypothetical protein